MFLENGIVVCKTITSIDFNNGQTIVVHVPLCKGFVNKFCKSV